jgi:hypothetical protein
LIGHVTLFGHHTNDLTISQFSSATNAKCTLKLLQSASKVQKVFGTMNPPSTLTPNTGCLKPDEFLPLRRSGSEAPVSPRRKYRDSNWWNNPNTQESLEDPFKAEKEGNDLKANTTIVAPASFVEEGDAPNPAEETLSIDTCPSVTQCEQAPKKFTNIPAEIQIASVTVTNVDESDAQEETTAAREYVPSSPTRRSWKPEQDETKTTAAREYTPCSPTRSVTFPVGKGDGVNKEAQPGFVLKNKGVITTEKNIEWEKPDWTKCRELKATGKADVLNSEGNLARPISLPVGSNNYAGTGTETNIASDIRSRITQPFASRRKFC